MRLIVVLLTFATVLSNGVYAEIYRGNLSESERKELPTICGSRYWTDKHTSIRIRSLGGNLVKNEEYPWVVALTDSWRSFKCTAVLISPRHALTAAHCVTTFESRRKNPKCRYTVMDKSLLLVFDRTALTNVHYIGWNTPSHSVVKVAVHNKFNSCNLFNDIALLEISPSISPELSPICMPHSKEHIPQSITSAGYGFNPHLFPDNRPLQILKLRYTANGAGRILTKTPRMSLCKGDSGGPLFKQNGTTYVLLGIATASDKCIYEDKDFKSYFEDVRYKLHWICKESGVCSQ